VPLSTLLVSDVVDFQKGEMLTGVDSRKPAHVEDGSVVCF